jgi:DNA-binding XRE family transcriptional regulator
MEKRLKRLREWRGFTQTQLAALVGYKHGTQIAKIEAGEMLPSLPKALALARVLGVRVEALVGRRPPRPLDPHTRSGLFQYCQAQREAWQRGELVLPAAQDDGRQEAPDDPGSTAEVA